MDLIWCRKNSKGSKYNLFLYLGDKGDMYYSIKSDGLSPVDISKIRSGSHHLDKLSIDRKIEWVKEYCPEAMNNFRTLKKKNWYILKRYKVN